MINDKTFKILNKNQLITRNGENILLTQKQEEINDFIDQYYGHKEIVLTKKEIERIINGEKCAISIEQEYTFEIKIIND